MRETTCYKILAFRFFQLHVLSFTLHRLLEKLSSTLNPGDLDPGLQDIVEVRVSPLTFFKVFLRPARLLDIMRDPLASRVTS